MVEQHFTPGVVTTPQEPLLWGREGDYIFFDDAALSWVTRVTDYIDLDTAGGYVVRNEAYIEVTT